MLRYGSIKYHWHNRENIASQSKESVLISLSAHACIFHYHHYSYFKVK